MRELFYEESAKIHNEKGALRKYYIFKTLSIISYVLMAVWIFVIFIGFDFRVFNEPILVIIVSILYYLIPFALFLSSGIILGRLKNKFYVDYDYTFVTGSVRISQVIKNYRRKSVLVFDVSSIEQLGKVGSETYDKYAASPGIKKLILTSNTEPEEGKDFYYLIVSSEGSKKLLILECSEIFLVNILKFANKSIVEKDFK